MAIIIKNVPPGSYFTAIRYDDMNAQLILDISSGHQHIYKNVSAEEANRILSDPDIPGKVAIHISNSVEKRGGVSKT